jgi:hypothetical protein
MSEKSRWAKLAGLPKQETKQQLDENVVGVGAVNQIFPVREPQSYETAFEHFLGEMYDSKAAERDDADHIDALEKDMEYDAIKEDEESIKEVVSAEAKERMEGLADIRNLKVMKDMLRILSTDWMQEGFEKEDIQDYITDFINKI